MPGEAAAVGEPVQLGILAGSKSQRQTAKKKQRKGGSSASALPLLDEDQTAPEKETRKRARSRSDDAKRYRLKQVDVLEAAETTCTRIRKCHPFALTVNRHSNGDKKNNAIPHPGHALYKSFEHKWQWVNMATSILDEVGDIVERNHGNSNVLMDLLLKHGCGGDTAKLAAMLSGSGYEGVPNGATEEDMADQESSLFDQPLVGHHVGGA